MILPTQRRIHTALLQAIARLGVAAPPPFAVETPPNRGLGDFAVTAAFQLARTLRRPPRVIAEELAASLGPLPGIARIVATPNGYLNFFLDRAPFALQQLRGEAVVAVPVEGAVKTVVEHTAINPNKAAHIGHLRNATLGDTLARVLRFLGTPVEVQNYIDDTGVQVADVIVGFRELERLTLDEVARLAESTRFDYYCWDLYSKVTEWYDGDKARLEIRGRTLHDLEHGGNDVAEMGAVIVDRIVRAHVATMARLNIAYDLLTYEGDILRLKFWAHAFDTLKAQGAVFLQTEGKLAGCWVMRIEDGTAADSEDEGREKVIVRSNGVVTYVGKDIANQFWKFGLLGRDFHYRRFATQTTGQTLWATTSTQGETDAPAFGRAGRIYNVIDSRQSYLQALLSQALGTLGHAKEAENSIHFSYEMVALSHATARELGYPPATDEEAKKPFVEVSGRKGLGVKVDDLLDLLIERATAEVAKRNPTFADEESREVATQLAVGAIRYFMLKFSRGTLLVFDIEEALSFQGESGPYLQYSVARANRLLKEFESQFGISPSALAGQLDHASAEELEAAAGESADHDLWALVYEASRLDAVVEQTVSALELSVLAKYLFGLAQLFSAFYHGPPILKEPDPARRQWRAAGVAYFRSQMTIALDLMGISVPTRM